MKKLLLTIFILVTSLSAKYVDSGAIMCNNYNAIIKLKKVIDTEKFWNVWGEVTSKLECTEVAVKITDQKFEFVDLGNGVTRINNKIYVFTQEVKN